MMKMRVLLPLLLVGGIGLAGCFPAQPPPPPPPPPVPITVVDTLGGLDVNTTFNVFGSGGQTIQQGFQAVGPQLVLTRATRITEIGGFVNNCASNDAGIFDCPNPKPVLVEIHPDNNGVPDPTTVLASVELPVDTDPLTVTFESARTHVSLPAGTYYALFTTETPADSGFILGEAQDPFVYRAVSWPFGAVTSSQPPSTTNQFGAVRILGEST